MPFSFELEALRADMRKRITKYGQASVEKGKLESANVTAEEVAKKDGWRFNEGTLLFVFAPEKSKLWEGRNTPEAGKKKIAGRKKS